MMAVPPSRGMPLKLSFRDYLGSPEQLLPQRPFMRQQLVAARPRVQAIRNDGTGPVLAPFRSIAIVERLRDHFMLAENRKPAEAKGIKVQRVRFPAIGTADPLIIRVCYRIRIRVQV